MTASTADMHEQLNREAASRATRWLERRDAVRRLREPDPTLTMLACGVITPDVTRITHLTEPVEHHVYTPARKATCWPFWLAALFFAAWLGAMLADIAATCAGRAGI